MATCSQHNCQLQNYKNFDKCILHCPKTTDYQDAKLDGSLVLFYNALLEETINQVSTNNTISAVEKLKGFLMGKNQDFYKEKQLKNRLITLAGIHFPERRSDYFDYEQFLGKIGKIHFIKCEYYLNTLELKESYVLFDECKFNEDWSVYDNKVLENASGSSYLRCIFEQEVEVRYWSDSESEENQKKNKIVVFENDLFANCIFNGSILLEKTIFEGQVFKFAKGMEPNFQSKIDKIEILGCTFNSRFIFNNYDVKKFTCHNSIFKEKFEFKGREINFFEILNTDFLKVADLFGNRFINFIMEKCNFEDVAVFGNCKFGEENNKESDSKKSDITTFKFIVFLDFVNLSNSIFFNGLDIETVSFKENANFLKTKINPKNTSRDTFRIVKNIFDKVGNYIEANTFYQFEMKSYLKELFDEKKYLKMLIPLLDWIVSDFGQSYLRPILGIILVGVLHCLIQLGFENNSLYKIFTPLNSFFSYSTHLLNNFAKNILPLSKFLKDGMEFLSLLFYIFYSSLFWQIIRVFKRHTKR